MSCEAKRICLINNCDIPEYVFKIHIDSQKKECKKY
jgi:hypothetical protein